MILPLKAEPFGKINNTKLITLSDKESPKLMFGFSQKLATYSHGPQRINPNDLHDPCSYRATITIINVMQMNQLSKHYAVLPERIAQLLA